MSGVYLWINYSARQQLGKQEDYRAINKQLFSLRESVFSLKLQGTFNVKSAFSSNEDIVQVSAGGNALNGTYKIAVKQLAEGAFKTSSAPLGSTDDYSTLSTQFEGLKGEIKFSINDQEFTVNTETESIYDLMNKINKADIGVQASYDRNLDRFFLSTMGTGENAQIEIVGGAYQSEEGEKNFFEDILNIDTGVVKGKNAEFTLNGAEFTMASNEFTINGINYSLKGVSPEGPGGEPVPASVSVKSDTDKIFDTIMDFVNLYNETIDKINGKLFEKYYRDYPPLLMQCGNS